MCKYKYEYYSVIQDSSQGRTAKRFSTYDEAAKFINDIDCKIYEDAFSLQCLTGTEAERDKCLKL